METQAADIGNEALKHFANPKNYGSMEDADGIGTGVDNATQNYATIYLKMDGDTIERISYAAHGSEDIVILGSIFTEMLTGATLEEADRRVAQLQEELEEAYNSIEPPEIDLTKPEGEQVSAVSTQAEGIDEESFTMSISKRCPYSNTDCAFVAHR